MVTGSSNGYVYDATGYHATATNIKCTLAGLTPTSDGIGFGWSGNGTNTYFTLYKN